MSDLEPGSRLGRYRLDRIIGRGGMGVVWAAHDFDLDRAIALKVIGVDHALPALRARLLREARAMARLKHPNVLTVFEVGSAGDRDFIAMELVDGGSLDLWLAEAPPPSEIFDALLAAGAGLAAAHAADLVHRDFKPHNILRSHDGRVLVTDFGLARGLGEETAAVPGELRVGPDATTAVLQAPALADTVASHKSGGSLSEPLTQTGALIGTPAYMAPEQFTGAPCDPRTDQFAYCVTAWQALTGERPFRGATVEALLAATLDGTMPETDLPADVHRVLARGLDPDPAKRWPDLEALLHALARARHARRRRLYAIGGAAGVLALALVGYAISRAAPATASDGPCSAPEAELAQAWSPALHDELVRAAPDRDGVARAFDRYGAIWLAAYRTACSAAGEKVYARVGCFLGLRDALAEERALGAAAGTQLLPEIALCTAAVPIAPPTVPDALRAPLRALRTRARELHGPDVATATRALLDEAKPLGWRPLAAEILLAGGLAAERAGELEAARELLGRAVTEAALAQHAHVEDLARLGLAALDLVVQDDPNDPGELARKLGEAREAIAASGDATALRARVEEIEAQRLLGQHRPRQALPHVDAARVGFVAAGELVRAAEATRAQLRALRDLEQDGGPAILDEVFKLVRAASDRDAYAILVDVRRELAWQEGRFDDAHGDDRGASPDPIGERTAGRVVDADGVPVADAIVVAWQGVLGGDARRLYARRDSFVGDVAITGRDGGFAIRVPPHGAIMAERGEQRTRPRLAAPGPLALQLGPTLSLETTIALPGETTGCAWFALDAETAWSEDAPIARDRSAAFANLPAGAPLCARDEHHRLAVDAVPSNRPLDVIVRNGEPGLRVVAPTAWGTVVPVGAATITDAGRALRYARGDLHVVLDGLAAGPQTVCAGRSCTTVDMPADPPAPDAKALAVIIEVTATHAATGPAAKPSDGR